MSWEFSKLRNKLIVLSIVHSMPTRGTSPCPISCLMISEDYQERSHTENNHVNDAGERRFGIIPRRPKEYSDCRPRPEKARVPILNVRGSFAGTGRRLIK